MRKQRNIIRIIHLIGAAMIGTFVYSPLQDADWFELIMQIGIIPLLTFTGIWLWKPKWFRKTKKASILLIMCITGMGYTSSVYGQDKLIGGSGGFLLGFKSYNTEAYNYFVRDDGPSLGNNLLQIGGEGYALINRFILGGSGYYSSGDSFSDNGNEYQIDGGGGFIHLGYVIFDRRDLLLFPQIGLGANALGIERTVTEDLPYSPEQFLQATYFVWSPALDVGLGLDWFPNNKGSKIGIRTGYHISFAREPDWKHPGGEITNRDTPSNNLDGFYIRLTLGGGYITRK